MKNQFTFFCFFSLVALSMVSSCKKEDRFTTVIYKDFTPDLCLTPLLFELTSNGPKPPDSFFRHSLNLDLDGINDLEVIMEYQYLDQNCEDYCGEEVILCAVSEHKTNSMFDLDVYDQGDTIKFSPGWDYSMALEYRTPETDIIWPYETEKIIGIRIATRLGWFRVFYKNAKLKIYDSAVNISSERDFIIAGEK